MPALPAVPSVVKIVHEGTTGGHAWATVAHWRYVTVSGSLTPAQLTLVCAKFVNSWRDNIRPYCGPSCIDTQVVGTDLTSDTAAVAIAPDGDAGSAGQEIVSPELAVLVTKAILRRYRGGHPRTYWPGLTEAVVNNDPGRSIDASQFTFLQEAFLAYYNDIPPAVTTDADTNVSSWREVSVSYHHAGVLRTVPVVDDVQAYNVHQVLATQRRRLHRG